MFHMWNKCNFFPDVLLLMYICSTFVPQNMCAWSTSYGDTKTLTMKKCILTSFMSFFHNHPIGSEYSCDHVHTLELLAALTPNDVLRYLSMKPFGTTEPAGDGNPILSNANSLAIDKKQFHISCCIVMCGVFANSMSHAWPVISCNA